jgi:hypothetical protein
MDMPLTMCFVTYIPSLVFSLSRIYTVLCKIIENPGKQQRRTPSPTEICIQRVYSTTTKYKWLPSCHMMTNAESRSVRLWREYRAYLWCREGLPEPLSNAKAGFHVLPYLTAFAAPFKLPLVERYNGGISPAIRAIHGA